MKDCAFPLWAIVVLLYVQTCQAAVDRIVRGDKGSIIRPIHVTGCK